jgi:2-polyprenyl-6-methoxyphenol hydroxylase-like FAD-dependent oxidoreductase
VATFVHSRYTREQALFLRSFHSLYLASPHPHGRFAFFGMQDAADPGKPETWTFFFYISWPSSLAEQDKEISTFTNADRLKQVKEMGKEYAEPWKSAFKWLPEDHPCWYLGLNVWDPSDPKHSWQNHSGRVTLAGDAAHPMTYRTSLII